MYQDQTYEVPRTFDKPTENLPSWGKPAGGFNGMAKYYGMVKCIDDNVGKILGSLRENDLIDNTIIVFTADHGDLRGEHHRQNKGVPYEGSAKIPLIVRWPAKIRAGTVINQALGCVDFLPTVLHLMDFETAGMEEGRDASALFVEGRAPADWNDITFVRGTGEEAGWLAAVTDRYKLIVSTADDPWLFDLREDPDELVNRFRDAACREIVRDLSRQLLDYGKKYKDPRIENEKIQADLAWAISGSGAYRSNSAVDLPARKAKQRRTKKARKNTN
jgi:arylsulfatase A-like enzyme